ncbi:hypothetical protein [Scytonema hofmannii]|uniref:hypothetical protein n=1 Tax=Scytonema hofmannii TaxID=34078 RepID=UPI0011DF1ED4|nr:hypothetical protein [Scytonema hofmannii]
MRDTNADLCAAINSPWLSLNEAKELVTKMLVSKKPINEILARLISIIYNSTVNPLELQPREKSNSIQPLISPPANCRLTNNEADQTKITAVRKPERETVTKSKMLVKQACEIKAQCRELKAQFREHKIKFIGSQTSFIALQPNFRNRLKPKAIERFD